MRRLLLYSIPLFLTLSTVAMEEPPKAIESGSAFTAKEVEEFVAFHNKVRQDVKVEPVQWSPTLANVAQQWADHLAARGVLQHRPAAGAGARKYGENLAINATILKGAEAWYAEIKDYRANTPIPADFCNFKSGHYTQMVWNKTTHIGAGYAIVQQGPFKGSLVILQLRPTGQLSGGEALLIRIRM